VKFGVKIKYEHFYALYMEYYLQDSNYRIGDNNRRWCCTQKYL